MKLQMESSTGEPRVAKVSLWMTVEEKNIIENRKQDCDLSMNGYLMRIIRKHIIEPSQNKREESEESGVRGPGLQSKPPTTNTISLSTTPATITAGGPCPSYYLTANNIRAD